MQVLNLNEISVIFAPKSSVRFETAVTYVYKAEAIYMKILRALDSSVLRMKNGTSLLDV